MARTAKANFKLLRIFGSTGSLQAALGKKKAEKRTSDTIKSPRRDEWGFCMPMAHAGPFVRA